MKDRTVEKVMAEEGLCVSMAEARRLCSSGMVWVDGEPVDGPGMAFPKGSHEIRIGKRTIRKVGDRRANRILL